MHCVCWHRGVWCDLVYQLCVRFVLWSDMRICVCSRFLCVDKAHRLLPFFGWDRHLFTARGGPVPLARSMWVPFCVS